MTTVAWSTGLLATDSQATKSNMAQPSVHPKIIIPPADEYWEVMGTKVVAIAIMGASSMLPWFTDALKQPGGLTHRTKLGLDREVSGSILAIDELGFGWVVGAEGPSEKDKENLIVVPTFPPFASGSGQPFANSVLAMGRDAKKAVQVAIRMDVFSGGLVQTYELPDPVKVKSVRPDPTKPNDAPVVPDPYGPVVPHPNQPPLQSIPEQVDTILVNNTEVA